jgi:hypothetical protein
MDESPDFELRPATPRPSVFPDRRPPGLRAAERVRQQMIASGDAGAKGGGQTKRDRELRAAARLAEKLGIESVEELLELFEQGDEEAFNRMRPLALLSLARDLNSESDMVRKAAWTRVLDHTDGKLAKDDNDAPKTVEFYSAALGDERQPDGDTFNWD